MWTEEQEKQWRSYKSGKLLIALACVLFLSSCSLFYSSYDVVLYRVQPGDTLGSIADRHHASFQELASINNISNPNRIVVGSVIEIPYRGKPKTSVARSNRDSLRLSNKKVSKTYIKAARQYVNQLYWPVRKDQFRLSSSFGWRWLKFHEGIDLAAKSGTPIYAAHPGKVVVSGYRLKGYGKMLIIQGDRILTVYAHNSRNYVGAGSYVKAGQHIAAIGSTGKVTGPHLHFEVRLKNGSGRYVAVDPLKFLS